MVTSPKGYSDSSPGGVAFSCNRSIPLNLRHSSRAFDYSNEFETFVFASKAGSLTYISNVFEFELDNPVDGQDIIDVRFSAHLGIVVTVSTKLVQVWDAFREVVGMPINPVHAVAVPSKPRCVHVIKRDNSCFIGLSSGKLMVMDLSACSSGIPRFTCTPYLELSTNSLTVIESTLDEQYMLVGTEDGIVKVIKYDSKKVCMTSKPPPGAGAVSSITAICTSNLPSFLVTFKDSKFLSIYQDGSLFTTINLPLPAIRAFSSLTGPILTELSDGTLLRLYGSSWSLSAPVGDFRCLGTRMASPHRFWSLELDALNSTTVVKSRGFADSDGPDADIGSLSLTASIKPGSSPNCTVSFSRHDANMEPHLIRLANDLTHWPAESGRRFVSEWNDKKWEGILVSGFNSEIFFSIFSHTTQRVIGRIVPDDIPELSVISALSVTCKERDRWSIVVGFSSGKIGLIHSQKSEFLEWSAIQFVDFPVHAGSRIMSIDRSLFNMIVTVDTEGMVCFSRATVFDLNKNVDGPAHVAIAGGGGACFTDSRAGLAYICMSDGSIERMKTPRRNPDGSEDIYDSDVFEAHTVAESVPLEGPFVALFPSVGIAVRQSGIVSLKFPTLNTGLLAIVNKSLPLREDAGNRIIEARTHIVGSHCYVVILTDTSVAAFDVTNGSIVPAFQRSHLAEHSTEIAPFFTESLHFIKWGVSITSVLFSDRVKDLISGETVIGCAQRHFGFPPIQSRPLVFEEPNKKGLLTRIFKKEKDPILGGEELRKYVPTEQHLQEARKQLAANLDAMAKLRENAAQMENSSADFLKLATELNTKKKKKFGFF